MKAAGKGVLRLLGRGKDEMMVSGSWKGKPLKAALKALEADIQLANTLAFSFPKGEEKECVQMRLKYGCAVQFLSFFVNWIDCRLACSLGLLRILVYKVMKDGSTTMAACERKASLRDFYACILPSLLVLESGYTQGAITASMANHEAKDCADSQSKPKKPREDGSGLGPELLLERERECGICFDVVPKVVLPGCSHALCLQCYKDWRTQSQSCPFCRIGLERVDSKDLWMQVDYGDVEDAQTVIKYNIERLFLYIDKLPLIIRKASLISNRKRRRHG